MNFHAMPIEEALRVLDTKKEGLTDAEVTMRLEKYGPNTLPEKRKRSPLLLFFKQFHSALVYILFAAAAISYFFERSIDAYVILAVILINAAIGFVQEMRAERAIEALKKLVVVNAKVLRGGELKKIPASELVPGDIIQMEEGDKAPADARILHEDELRTLEASLTGESVPVDKDTTLVADSTPLADRTNMIWMGTLVAAGAAIAAVTATGANTAIGQLAHAVAAIKPKQTHFRKRTDELAWTMGVVAVIGAVITLIAGWFLLELRFVEIFLFSIAALVSSMPEGLPAVLTIVLAVGAFRMARAKAIVRHLPSTETLAVVTVIATDKTGTLTQNSMTARKVLLGNGEEFEVTGAGWNPKGEFLLGGSAITPLDHPPLSRLLHCTLFGSAAKLLRTDGGFDISGDPTEAALTVLSEKAGLSESHFAGQVNLLDELPFQRKTKYRARLFSHSEDGVELLVIGAFEAVLKLSDKIMKNGKGDHTALGATEREKFLKAGEDFARQALRVLAVAYRSMPAKTQTITHDDVAHLTFVGLVGMIDPPRPEAKAAIAAAQQAGIRVLMKTGDHAATALAIAQEVGIAKKDEQAAVLTDEDLVNLSDDAFDKAVRRHSVFARVTPKTKLRIAQSLQRQGEVVAVTGDGVNDAPALRQADIGIAMGRIGTDVAREASDIILEDDNFATIVEAIEEGRTVFRNTQQASFYLVTTNIAEYATILGALVLGLPLPLLPVHLLWMNIVTDGITDVALASEPKHDGMLKEPPRRREERILNKKVLPFLALMVLIMLAGTVAFFVWSLPEGLERARTLAFAFMAWAQLWNVWNMRAIDRSVFKIGLFQNNFVNVAFLAGAAVQFLIIGLPFFQNIFQFVALSGVDWLLVIASSSLVLWFGEVYKMRLNNSNGCSP